MASPIVLFWFRQMCFTHITFVSNTEKRTVKPANTPIEDTALLSVETEAEMRGRRSHEVLPRPTRLHHTVEDFLTTWDAPNSHILPLRRFVESTVNHDLRSFFADTCLLLALTYTDVPLSCRRHYLAGQGLQRLTGSANSATAPAVPSERAFDSLLDPPDRQGGDSGSRATVAMDTIPSTTANKLT